MPCCPSSITFFADVETTTIPYPDLFKTEFGLKPRVDVYYFDEELGEFYNTNGVPSSEVKFDGSNININHGGPASGYVKIS